MSSRQIKICQMIAEDMKKDAKNMDGMPFNGKTLGICLGSQGAAIVTLANIVKSLLERNK